MNTSPTLASASHRNQSRTYRPDIDGLRAIAVLAVVGFHGEIAAFRGGFAGVDVFFVISGYLISGIIVRSLENDRFSFAGFYARRVNRIMPALLVVLVATAIVGWFILFAREFVSLGKHILGGALFYSNFALWSEAGYFDSQAKPLLHLWSLAVEEQFYLLWPLLVVTAWKRRIDLLLVIVPLVTGSFILSIVAIATSHGTAAFFSPVTRFWEIGIGALLFQVESVLARKNARQTVRPLLNEIAALVGIGLIALALIKVSEKTPWPGWWALAPAIGTAMIVAAGPQTWINGAVLGNRLLVAVGLVSYPLYLWHWPVMVMARLVNEGQLPRSGRLGLMIVSLGLAFVTYRFLEIPIRFGKRKRRSAGRLVIALAGVAIVGILIDGAIRPRLDVSLSRLAEEAEKDGSGYPGGGFRGLHATLQINAIPGDSMRTIVFIGDSHVEQYWPRAVELSRRSKQIAPEILFITHEGCPTLPDINPTALSAAGSPYHCNVFVKQAIARASMSDVKAIVLGGFWENYLTPGSVAPVERPAEPQRDMQTIDVAFATLETQVLDLTRAGKVVYLILSNPVAAAFHPDSILEPRRLPFLSARARLTTVSRKVATARAQRTNASLRAIARRTGAVVIDPADYMCDSTCSVIDERGEPIYIDSNHMRGSYARAHATFIDRVLGADSVLPHG
jgi:peptidoglycan/LPS O-acetylase OafA/YrhL